jgi:hypothetical protein
MDAGPETLDPLPLSEQGKVGSIDHRCFLVVTNDGNVDHSHQQVGLRPKCGIDGVDSRPRLGSDCGKRCRRPALSAKEIQGGTDDHATSLGRLPSSQWRVVSGRS